MIAINRYSSPTLPPALLLSLAVHAAAGGLLLNAWQRAPVELPRPLTVTLEAPSPALVENSQAVVEHHIPKPVPSEKARPVLNTHHAPLPAPIAIERAEPAFVAPAPAPPAESVAAPTVVAKASTAGAGDAIEPPHFNVAYLNNPRPAYPPVARRLGLEGVVVLRVQVSARGTPEQVVIAQTSGASVLDDAALKAVQGWTFVPARRGDTPIAHAVDVPIRFRLQN